MKRISPPLETPRAPTFAIVGLDRRLSIAQAPAIACGEGFMRIETLVTIFVHGTALAMLLAAGWVGLALFLP